MQNFVMNKGTKFVPEFLSIKQVEQHIIPDMRKKETNTFLN